MTGAATPSATGLVTLLAADARARAAALLTERDEAVEQRRRGHRGLMTMVKAAVVSGVHSGVHSAGPTPSEVAGAAGWLSELEELQTATGLFSSGDNLASPPDSAFTISDAALVLRVLRTAGPGAAWPDDLGNRLERVLRHAMPALIVGGVHTPNHRWELSGALARAGELLGARFEVQALERAREWLAEGVDVDADGLYSERSANYAAHVSNPSLLALAGVLGRIDLLDHVHRNLHAQLDLTSPSGEVETVHSRRQDQKHSAFPLGSFAAQLARFAVSCARCRSATAWAVALPGVDSVEVLAQAMVDDDVRAGLAAAEETSDAVHAADVARGVAEEAETVRWFGGVRLLRRTRGHDWATVYGGSDVSVAQRIASGLACNPTFLRLALGRVEVSSVRLSRDFFGLGPFRAASVEYDPTDPGLLVMREELAAGYYQPLAEPLRRSNGVYPLEFEGRFAAAMGFGARSVDLLPLRTSMTVKLTDDGAELTVTTDGAATAHALEIGLRDEPDVAGAAPLGEGRYHLIDGEATVTSGGTTLLVGLDGAAGAAPAPHYHPGEAYTFLDGTDAVSGTRLYATWSSPGSITVRLRRT